MLIFPDLHCAPLVPERHCSFFACFHTSSQNLSHTFRPLFHPHLSPALFPSLTVSISILHSFPSSSNHLPACQILGKPFGTSNFLPASHTDLIEGSQQEINMPNNHGIL
uniref:Uncharacterized protein n=1 Tax=Micrurus corallinus TaxID=54390 RepID=A0A2D4EW09_MICCO